jgi:hypothetical protein
VPPSAALEAAVQVVCGREVNDKNHLFTSPPIRTGGFLVGFLHISC